MSRRLADQYRPGEPVEITFDGRHWQPATVARHQPPGVWVETADGRAWFVTNTRRIRPAQKGEP
jgi:hypothetical protein